MTRPLPPPCSGWICWKKRSGLAEPLRRERQRVHIAGRWRRRLQKFCWMNRPTTDIHHQMQLMHLISDLPVTSIVAIHDLNHASMFCDSLIVMQQGQIVATGTPQEILSEALLWDVFGSKPKSRSRRSMAKAHSLYRLSARNMMPLRPATTLWPPVILGSQFVFNIGFTRSSLRRSFCATTCCFPAALSG